MLKKILSTIGTRYFTAFLNLALIFINAKVLGLEGVGLVGLIVASVNIAIIFTGILSGNTIVYFMSKYPIRTLLPIAYGWSFLGAALACLFLNATGLMPRGYGWDVYLITILNSFVVANARFLLGKDQIKGFNITYFFQAGFLFFVLLFLYYILDEQYVHSYVHAMYIVNGTAFLVSLLLLIPHGRKEEKKENGGLRTLPGLLREMFSYGLWAGADNLAEVLTTRLNYFMIQRFGGLGSVGLLDAGTKISEGVLNVSRSVSFIEYGEVARTDDPAIQKRITLQLFKVTFCALLAIMVCILCIPEWVYTDYLFSPEFTGMRRIIIALSAGIVALGSNSILSHYFIGSGKVKYSTVCSCLGLLTLSIAGYLLIPHYGVTGAAISSSIAFIAMLCFSLTAFTKLTHTHLKEFILNKQDWSFLWHKIKRR